MRLTPATIMVPLLLWSVCGRGEEGWRLEALAKGWQPSEKGLTQGADGAVVFQRIGVKRARIVKTFRVDLDRTPVVEIVTGPGLAHWRLTGQTAGGREIVLADFQTEGTCRRSVAKRLLAKGAEAVTLRVSMWGWGGSDQQRLALERVAFVPDQAESNADRMSGLMLERHRRALERAKSIQPVRHEHPSLRYRKSQRPDLIRKARTTHKVFAQRLLTIVDDLAAEKAKPSYVLEGDLLKGTSHRWRGGLLQLRPPEPPTMRPGEGRYPFAGARAESTWRVLCWHDFSLWVIGSALTDDPAFAEQARRWVTALARWQFWRKPSYIYFDFNTSYPLQNLAFGYDIAHGLMTEDERALVRDAIAELARGLYLNTLTGHGSIYNDLRGNHTSVTQCGLGLAGLVLLGEHPEAAQWAALAEQFMLDCFEEHTSGAWTESPSYGQYGVDEWLKLAEALRNVAGRDHHKHPFFQRYADCSLMIHDWEGRNLGYNGGGWASRWNHWIFFRIANELRRPDVQWLAEFCTKGSDSFTGYGDAFWWADPTLEAKRPTGTNVGAHYADVGISVWRSGWEDDASILLHHCGRKGQHKEENMNHFTLYVAGHRMLPDGVGARTADHNVPVAGGRKQNKWMPGATLRFHTDERAGYSLGDASRSYGRRALRHLLYLRSGVLAVVDDIEARAGRDTALAFHLHPNGRTRVESDCLHVRGGNAALVAMVVAEDGRPLPLTASPRQRKGMELADVAAARKAGGPTRTITLLRFGKASEMPADALVAEKGEGHIDFVCGSERLRLGVAPGVIAPGLSTDGELWLAQLVEGTPRAVLAVSRENDGGVSIEGKGVPVQGRGCVSWSPDGGR